jgi:tetratricopeptide (TPR) repeat protein
MMSCIEHVLVPLCREGDAIMSKADRTGRWLLAAAALAIFITGAARADEKQDLKEKALKLNSITGKDPIDGKIKELVKDAENTKKLLKVAAEMAKEKDHKLQYNAAYILARAARELKEQQIALDFFNLSTSLAMKLKSSTKLLESFDGKISLLYELKKFDDAEKACQELLDMEFDPKFEDAKIVVLEQMIQFKAKQGKIEEALKLTENLIKLDEGGWYFLRLKGWVLHEGGKNKEAVDAYLETIKILGENKRLRDDEKERWIERTHYILSSVYVDMNEIDKAAEQLQTILKKKPDHPTYNNDLGYIWADHDKNLDESEKLIRKALDEDRKLRKKNNVPAEADKDNSAYLDSLGWVLFKKKQYPEAKKYLLEAVKEEDGQHIEILDHLADVHMALGEKNEAVAVWKKAQDLEPANKRDLKRLGEIRKKLKAAEGK